MPPSHQQAPELIYLLPPLIPARTVLIATLRLVARVLLIGAAVIACGAWFMLNIARGSGQPWSPDLTGLLLWPGAVLAAAPVLIVALLAWEARVHNARARRTRAGILSSHPESASDPRCEMLPCTSRLDWSLDFRGTAACIRASDRTKGRAVIACLPGVDVPAVEDIPVEPILLPPSHSNAAIFCMQLAAFPVLCFLLGFFVGVPSRWLLTSCAAAAVVGAIAWCWHVLFFPRYVRLAPGIIQVLRYLPFSRSPRVVHYPFDRNTVIFVHGLRGKAGLLHLAVCRGDRCEAFGVPAVADEQYDQVWRALLSTAPTPALSASDLVG